MDDAYLKADSMVDSKSELGFLRKLNDKKEPENTPERIEVKAAKVEGVSLDWESKFINLSSLYREQEARVSNMADIIMKMQHAMNDIIGEVNELRGKLEQSRSAAPVRRQEVAVEMRASAPAPRVEVKEAVAAPEVKLTGNNHPRSGGYQAEDVAIDKIFYFGNKK
ncbi:hypothetical protein COV93_02855 [Candidatus Woesearchaeota archaeon CG11_big_fil_rev_8_21_14_0_20_43_8]|nr:MAG: hypothetical protein COV93_02855 [Candidatus Woesearchaeota archaeon CG11_big_fil_rev_8_21_14_0_20_43_8]PIO07082.1 MAG: hypothetical protein COT47_01585 [Candidatus Woesearchaeota archaeon CG08_land_8_20_14_0_20_43_7]